MGYVTVFGGTFNPIHIGHCEIIDNLSNSNVVDELIIMPTKIPPHKYADNLATYDDRYNMCKIIANDYNNVKVSDLELKRIGKSFTIDTVNTLQKMYSDKRIAITIGGDMLVSFDKWKSYQEIIDKCTLFVFRRNNISEKSETDSISKLRSLGADIVELDKRITDISSTRIREELYTFGKSCYLDPRINDYIAKNKLYGV